jgi:hypothetical protein
MRVIGRHAICAAKYSLQTTQTASRRLAEQGDQRSHTTRISARLKLEECDIQCHDSSTPNTNGSVTPTQSDDAMQQLTIGTQQQRLDNERCLSVEFAVCVVRFSAYQVSVIHCKRGWSTVGVDALQILCQLSYSFCSP